MNLSSEQYQQISTLHVRDEKIRKLLKLESWTPAMVAQLIYGIDVPFGITDIITDGRSLDGKILLPSDRAIRDARNIFNEWMEYHSEDSEVHKKARREIDWTEFFAFFIEEDFKTPWMCLVMKLAGIQIPGYESTMPDAMNILFSSANATPNSESVINNKVKSLTTPNGHSPSISALPTKRSNNSRWNSLRTHIESAKSLAKGEKTTQDVYEVLKEMALDSQPPFSHVKDGVLWYTDNNDIKQPLTRRMLGQRLARYSGKVQQKSRTVKDRQ